MQTFLTSSLIPHQRCPSDPHLSFPALLESDRGSPSGTASCASDMEDDLSDSLRRGKYSELHRQTTPPSQDSAMDSWDSSALDAGYGSQGAEDDDKRN